MNLPKSVVRLCVAATLLGAGSLARAQTPDDLPKPKPTDEHKVLASEAGAWDASIKAYMAGPDAPPAMSKGVETNRILSGGLWLISDFKGEFAGQSFEGHGQYGYDPLKKKYVGTWVDSMSPSISSLEGTYDAKTKTMTLTGDGVDPATKSKYSQKMVTVTKDDGTRVFTLYMTSPETGGKETKFMEITYTKRK